MQDEPLIDDVVGWKQGLESWLPWRCVVIVLVAVVVRQHHWVLCGNTHSCRLTRIRPSQDTCDVLDPFDVRMTLCVYVLLHSGARRWSNYG